MTLGAESAKLLAPKEVSSTLIPSLDVRRAKSICRIPCSSVDLCGDRLVVAGTIILDNTPAGNPVDNMLRSQGLFYNK